MSQADLISPLRFLTRLPQHLPRVPRMLRGLYYAGIRNREKQLSLAWALERAALVHGERPALLVPEEALARAGQLEYVDVMASGRKERVLVRAVPAAAGYAEILAGVKAGDVIALP